MLLIFKSEKEFNQITKRDIRLANPIFRKKSERASFLSLLFGCFCLGILVFTTIYILYNYVGNRDWKESLLPFVIGTIIFSLFLIEAEFYFRYLKNLGEQAELQKQRDSLLQS